MAVRALRGATTVEADSPEDVTNRTIELMTALLDTNEMTSEALISILFSATPDITSLAPATGLRGGIDLSDVPLLCVGEMIVDGGLERCIRIMAHVETQKPRHELTHLFLHGAAALRPDLAEASPARGAENDADE